MTVDKQRKPAPESVFTPRAPVSREMFARRDDGRLQQRFEDALREPGSQIMLYGDTGVGKTSLVLHVANEMNLGVARIECFSGKSFHDLLSEAFAAIAEVQELRIEVSTTQSAGAEVSGGGGFGWLAYIRGQLRSEAGTAETREFQVVQKPLIDALFEKMIEAGRNVIFFDNFENVTDADVRGKVAQFIVFVSDRAQQIGNLKVIVAGIADTAADLLSMSDAASRRTIDFEVPRMPPQELERILNTGMSILDLIIGTREKDHIVELSDGFPYVVHLIGLHAARSAMRTTRAEVTGDDVTSAVRSAVEEFSQECRKSLELAEELSGKERPRLKILRALAHAKGRDFSTADVRQLYQRRFQIDSNKNFAFLNVALGALLSAERGAVLRRRGARRRYRYSFRNPLMRPYILMVEDATAQFNLPL
jgi:Cdc6-like AAA superfamily ATPase